ncbi:hypothetical protein TrLO_g333 [Triparma laevis f. longispina]|uniref:BART domain-containing protein n=1 Tax=Triparma laevis f. longispina TaxID=1714387 RepID=A0A9W7B3J6_9STRA|nr:hypothetical protein TrLO_g333 [Triparma laevis f. longispina]
MEQGAEHQLEFHACFEEYLEHFEGKIKRFIESTGEGTVDDFYEECRIALETLGDFHPKRFFIEALLATTEYPIFFSLMMGEVRKQHPDYKPETGEVEVEEEGQGRK